MPDKVTEFSATADYKLLDHVGGAVSIVSIVNDYTPVVTPFMIGISKFVNASEFNTLIISS